MKKQIQLKEVPVLREIDNMVELPDIVALRAMFETVVQAGTSTKAKLKRMTQTALKFNQQRVCDTLLKLDRNDFGEECYTLAPEVLQLLHMHSELSNIQVGNNKKAKRMVSDLHASAVTIRRWIARQEDSDILHLYRQLCGTASWMHELDSFYECKPAFLSRAIYYSRSNTEIPTTSVEAAAGYIKQFVQSFLTQLNDLRGRKFLCKQMSLTLLLQYAYKLCDEHIPCDMNADGYYYGEDLFTVYTRCGKHIIDNFSAICENATEAVFLDDNDFTDMNKTVQLMCEVYRDSAVAVCSHTEVIQHV